MKKIFYTGLLGLALFEILKVYFIMPMPGSQDMNSIDLAYFLFCYRWLFRVGFGLMIGAGLVAAFQGRGKWVAGIALLLTAAITYLFNFQMMADKMFLQPQNKVMQTRAENKVPETRLIIGVVNNGAASAYPIEYLAYHHQVQDTIGGKAVMVTYCSVCRTGCVYEPMVNGVHEKFRLVGMDHFNAMFEDATTKSWWRQATGEAIAGKLKGSVLPEVESRQMSLDKWLELYPQSLIMQPDENSIPDYDPDAHFEQGKSKGSLTRTDTLAWKDKSWVLGVEVNKVSKAYDWMELKRVGVINDTVGGSKIVVAVSADGKSFGAFLNPFSENFSLRNDTLICNFIPFDFNGHDLILSTNKLKPVNAYQEFWHSWRTFHPATLRY